MSCTDSVFYADRFLRFFDQYTYGRGEDGGEGGGGTRTRRRGTQSPGEATSEDELGS